MTDQPTDPISVPLNVRTKADLSGIRPQCDGLTIHVESIGVPYIWTGASWEPLATTPLMRIDALIAERVEREAGDMVSLGDRRDSRGLDRSEASMEALEWVRRLIAAEHDQDTP